MKTQEFIDKWKHEIKVSKKMMEANGQVDWMILNEFEEDCWEISKEEKPRTPMQKFLFDWRETIETVDMYSFEKFAGDVYRLVEWAKKEGRTEIFEKLNQQKKSINGGE
jgi:hypothetical protein